MTRADFSLSRELVLGFKGDLLPRDERYWSEIHCTPRFTVEAAARKALEEEAAARGRAGNKGSLEEAWVQLVSPKLENSKAPLRL